MTQPIVTIDGARISSLDDLWDELERALIPGVTWGRNLDALDDILRGGFGTPDGGFTLQWKNARVSRASLGHAATARWLEAKAARGLDVGSRLDAARNGTGETLFEMIVAIIRSHDDVTLELLD